MQKFPTTDRHANETIESAVAQTDKIDAIVVEPDAFERVPELLRRHFISSTVFMVADENTMTAAGHRLQAIFGRHGIEAAEYIFPGSPRLKPSVEIADKLLPGLRTSAAVPVAVGSGVINDLVKYAAFQANRPYLCVATAASMDGYASAGSPLSQKGFKHTIACAPPRVIVADCDVLAKAPKDMAGWGYGDLAGKIVAGADWLVADALGIEAIDDKAWPLIQDRLRFWLDQPEKVRQGDAAKSRFLFTGLVMAGVAMEIYQSSRPASGADHQMAHLWEMEGIEFNGMAVSHGILVALGTLTILGLYEWTLAQKFEHLNVNKTVLQRRPLAELETDIRQRFTKPAMAARILAETRAKYVADNVLCHRLERLRATWPDLRKRLAQYLVPFARMKSMLAAAGVATDPTAVGIDRTYHRQTLLDARFIRRRYTILDLLEETGYLDAAVEHIFASDGYWG